MRIRPDNLLTCGKPVLWCVALLAVSHPTRAEPPAGYKLAWSDEFNGLALDADKWVHWLPGKRNEAFNVRDAVSFTNGCLVITSFTERGTNFTGMVSTRGRFAPVRGYWEARIRFDDLPGMWSAFWLQSPTMGRPHDDPAKAGIEIDIAEHRATDKNGEHIAGKVQHTLHWNGYGEFHKSDAHASRNLGLDSGFHIYGFEWTDSAYRFYVDGKVTWTVNQPISRAPEFLILSSEIRGRGWAGDIPTGGYGDRATSHTRMLVDYVRYYSRE